MISSVDDATSTVIIILVFMRQSMIRALRYEVGNAVMLSVAARQHNCSQDDRSEI